jgi:hypothetical protein
MYSFESPKEKHKNLSVLYLTAQNIELITQFYSIKNYVYFEMCNNDSL